MSREKTVVKNTLIMAIGTFLPRIINLLTTPIITSSTTDAQFGQLDLVTTTILSFIVPVSYTHLVPPSHVHVLVNGKIILSGGKEVVEKIDQEGYDWVKELGIEITSDEKKPILQMCIRDRSCCK